MNKGGKIIHRNPKTEFPEKPQEFSSLKELFKFSWISDWKEDLEKISRSDYDFKIAFEEYRDDYPYALMLVSKNHSTIVGWCDDNDIIKELPNFRSGAMKFNDALIAKKMLYRERNIFGSIAKDRFLIVPSKKEDFDLYLNFILKMEWNLVIDETAINFCTDDKYIFARITNTNGILNFERLYVKDGVPTNCVNGWEHLETRSH